MKGTNPLNKFDKLSSYRIYHWWCKCPHETDSIKITENSDSQSVENSIEKNFHDSPTRCLT